MKTQRHGTIETQSTVVDVLLLDVLAQIESLLRSGREVQRELLRVRGVPLATTTEQQRKAATRAQSLVVEMLTDSCGLVKVVHQLRGSTNGLARQIERRPPRSRTAGHNRREQAANASVRREK
jgi:hypothetical protein